MPRLLLLLLLSIATGLVAGASDQPQPATLDALDRDIRAGAYGNIDHIVVLRGDTVLANHKYARDYAAISRGRTSPIGCGDGCTDPAWLHEFNYFHPRTHPYFEGRHVHSLQSVTPTGHPDTEDGRYLTAKELARIGRLYIAKGRWGISGG